MSEPQGLPPGAAPATRCSVCDSVIAAGAGRYLHGNDEWCVACHERDQAASASRRP